MALDEELYEWAQTRPWWQQQALARLTARHVLGKGDYELLAAAMLGATPTPPEGGWLGGALRPVATAGEPVRLLAVRGVSNVNALVNDQTLTFGPVGLTVVYGNNGSGKSGYARLLKRRVRARHREDILPDVFESSGPGASRADVEYVIGDQHQVAHWDEDVPALSHVAFYDEKCGDRYVSTEAEVTYRPAALQLLDALIGVCDGVRGALDERLAANTRGAVALPALPDGTPSAGFVANLDARTSDEAIDEACTFTDADVDGLERSLAEEARLRASDPTQEKAHLGKVATVADAVAAELTRVAGVVGVKAETQLRQLAAAAVERRAAATVASSASFDAEPVPGVGSGTWRALWEAAREFSEGTAWPSQPFPPRESDARCPLCQQVLDDDAGHRLHRFHAFMTDNTETQARLAERALDDARDAISATVTMTPTTAVHLEVLRSAHAELAGRAQEVLRVLEERRTALGGLPDVTAVPAAPDAAALAGELTGRAVALRAKADAIDAAEFASLLDAATAQRQVLEARKTLAERRETVIAERDRRRDRAVLEAARRETDTTGITRRSTELTRTYVTLDMQDRFSRESDRLGVERVTLADVGGRKGQLMQRPAFLGAAVRAELPHVLSEGEQTALGLAGFFTEAYFDATRSALVLDDPVTSLDHLRREKVASRLVEFARDRQVIVFTHDTAFVADLRRAADEKSVVLTERAVERRIHDDAPGVCVDAHPWKAKDANRRLGDLRTELARIRRDCEGWDRDTYERETALWAGGLSETWERIISMEIANQLVDRDKLEVRVKMMKVVARITVEDNREFQESYGRCSLWAKRHDKDQALNYVAPKPNELEAELNLVTAWLDRVRKYKNN